MASFTTVLLIILMLAGAFLFVSFIINQDAKTKKDALERALTLADIDNMDGIKFEHYVARLLGNEGFVNIDVSKASGDFGADITASMNHLRYAIQVKRQKSTVSRRAVSDAVAAKGHYSCNAAMVVTNNYLSKQSQLFANSVGCTIVDRDVLGEWVIRFQASGPQEEIFNRNSTGSNFRIEPVNLPAMLNLVTQQRVPASVAPVREIATGRISSEIIEQIKTNAERQFPKDFSTRAYVVDEQLKAFTELQSRPSTVPSSVLDIIKEKAETDFPDDYCTRLYVVNEQIEAFLKLEELNAHSRQSKELKMILEEASQNYPCDFSTRLYVVEEQQAAFESLMQLR